MIRSLLGAVDLARDASVAVGAYVGVLREHVKTEWATVLGGSFDERVAQARARMEAQADALEKAEEAGECLEPGQAECRCPSCLDVLRAEQEAAGIREPVDPLNCILCGNELNCEGQCAPAAGVDPSGYCGFIEPDLSSPASVAACQRTEEARSGATPRPAPGLSKPEAPLSHYELRTVAMGIDKLIPHELESNRLYWRLLSARIERIADVIEAQQ